MSTLYKCYLCFIAGTIGWQCWIAVIGNWSESLLGWEPEMQRWTSDLEESSASWRTYVGMLCRATMMNWRIVGEVLKG